MKAIILAGGLGTRLKAVTGDLPKPMVPLLGRPMMEHILLLLKEQGFTRVCAALRYRPDLIRSALPESLEALSGILRQNPAPDRMYGA